MTFARNVLPSINVSQVFNRVLSHSIWFSYIQGVSAVSADLCSTEMKRCTAIEKTS